MLQYTWEIESVDNGSGTMVVSYTHEGMNVRYNVPIPTKADDLETWVDNYAPKNEWVRTRNDLLMQVTPGLSGSGSFNTPEEADAAALESSAPNVVGSWNEEYIRALIYSVLEEVRAEQV